MYFLSCVVCIFISVFKFEVSKHGQKRKLGFDFPEFEVRMEDVEAGGDHNHSL